MFIEKIALFYSDNLKPKKLTWGGRLSSKFNRKYNVYI